MLDICNVSIYIEKRSRGGVPPQAGVARPAIGGKVVGSSLASRHGHLGEALLEVKRD
jgi:hypothetical protein